MKKILFIFTALFLTNCIVCAETNMPSAPVWNVPKTTVKTNPSSTSSTSVSGPSGSVGSIAKALAAADLNGNDDKVGELYGKLMDMGVTNINIEEHVNSCPYRKGITPITLGGKTYSGQTCVLVKYTYQGKSTGTGACK